MFVQATEGDRTSLSTSSRPGLDFRLFGGKAKRRETKKKKKKRRMKKERWGREDKNVAGATGVRTACVSSLSDKSADADNTDTRAFHLHLFQGTRHRWHATVAVSCRKIVTVFDVNSDIIMRYHR